MTGFLSGASSAVLARLAQVEINLGVNTLRDIIEAGWSYLGLAAGIADEFEDETGVDTAGSTGETYDAVRDCYGNEQAEAKTQSQELDDGNFNLGASGWVAQSFQVSTTDPVNKVSLFRSVAVLAGDVFDVRIETDNAGAPSGTLVAAGALKTGTTMNAANQWYDFELDTPFIPATSTTYWLRLNRVPAGAQGNFLDYKIAGAYAGGRAIDGNGSLTSGNDLMFRVYQRPLPANMSLRSIVHVADAQPETARAVILLEPIDAVTLNTDCIFEVSRDGGTTWTAGTLTNEGAFDATTDILAAEVSLGTQPAGTNMRWRFRIANNKGVDLHGVYLQWG